MLSIKVDTSGLKSSLAMISGMQKQVSVATAKALTFTAERVEKAVYEEMRTKFDRPTPMTMRSLRKKTARVSDLTAMVYLKDTAIGGKNPRSMAEILAHEFGGGDRIRSRLEGAFSAKGYMSSSEYLVPAAGAKLDQYGNVSRGQIGQIFAQLKVGLDIYSHSNYSARSRKSTAKAGVYFWSFGRQGTTTVSIRGGEMVKGAGRQNHLPRGVWLRVGAGVLPVLIVARKPSYKQRIDMEKIARQVIDKDFDSIFSRVLDAELRRVR